MENYDVFELPLYSDPSYSYEYSLEGNSYSFRYYFNTLMNSWIYDIRDAEGNGILLGRRLVGNYPMVLDYPTPLKGFFMLLPIANLSEEETADIFHLNERWQLFYFSPKEDDGED